MRIYLLVICFFLASFPTSAAEVGYELTIGKELKTTLILYSFNDDYLREFSKGDSVVLKSEEHGTFHLTIVPNTDKAEGVIPFSWWSVQGIQVGQQLLSKPFAFDIPKQQRIRDVNFSHKRYLNKNTETDTKGSFSIRQEVNCYPGKTIHLTSGLSGKGDFALLLTPDDRFIDQYFRRPSADPQAALMSCRSHSGKAFLYRTSF